MHHDERTLTRAGTALIVAVVVSLIWLLVQRLTAADVPRQLPAGPVGRYALCAARVEEIKDGERTTEHVLFRIDTTTGQTWRYHHTVAYVENVGLPVGVDGWLEIAEDWAHAARGVYAPRPAAPPRTSPTTK